MCADSMRGRFEAMIREAQNSLCAEVEALDGGKFHEDAWTRPGGGGGVSRVLQASLIRTRTLGIELSAANTIDVDDWCRSPVEL